MEEVMPKLDSERIPDPIHTTVGEGAGVGVDVSGRAERQLGGDELV